MTGAAHDAENSAIDGCSIPTYAIPIRSLALGFAKMATGERLSAERAKAAKRLFAACMAEPFFVSGSDAADLSLMQAAPGRIFVKSGAEGVYCAAVPELGLGIALKCDDGAEPSRRGDDRGRAGEAAEIGRGAFGKACRAGAAGCTEPEGRAGRQGRPTRGADRLDLF